MFDDFCAIALYLIEILHQTTTSRRRHKRKKALYLIEILHQTTTFSQSISTRNGCILSKFYIKPQLRYVQGQWDIGCILSKFYIKPQQMTTSMKDGLVVSYRNSTSNHNSRYYKYFLFQLYLIEILHQTTTMKLQQLINQKLYLIEILHQTTTIHAICRIKKSCILSKFYIKPQQSTLSAE